jgi:amidase
VTEIHDLTVTELSAAIRAGQLSPVEITEHYLQRIERLNDQVGAFYTVTPEVAREQAAAAEKAVASELRGGGGLAGLPPLTGIPVPIKDLNMVAGVRLTYGCTLLADNIATEDDYVVAALRTAGTVLTGKTATPEFGLPCLMDIGGSLGTEESAEWIAKRVQG